MHLKIIIFFLLSLISAAEIGPFSFERRRALEKSLLKNLQLFHTGQTVETVVNINEVCGSDDDSFLSKLPFDIQQYFLSFLNPSDLLKTRLINRQYRGLSDYANYRKIYKYSPNFVLNETWMNFAMSKFLYDYFGSGCIKTDELLFNVHSILFDFGSYDLEAGRYPACFAFIAFIYEYENGVGSSLPMMPVDVYVEILANFPQCNSNSALWLLREACTQLEPFDISEEERNIMRDFSKKTIEFIANLDMDPVAIRDHFNFDPNLPLEASRLNQLPPFFRVAMFNLILPLCDEEERFSEAIEMANSAYSFSQVLLDHLNEKFPHLVDEMFGWEITMLPNGKKALQERELRSANGNGPDHVVGLEYLLTRNTENRFNLQELLEMNPDISLLMSAYLPCNKLPLTESDLISQMKEANLFVGIHDGDLIAKIEAVISGEIRLNQISDYSEFSRLMRLEN